jgi:hypothetical protein
MITREAVQVLPGIMNTLAAEPEVIQDEDRLGDILMDFIPEVRAESELWAYVEEMLMEVYDEDDISKIEEIQYDCAQSMEYNLGSLLTKLIQQAYAEVRALGEDTDDDDLFSDRPNGKVIAQDLELWLRRRQSGSRRTLMPTSEKYVQEVIAAFNRSFLEGVQIWREYPLYGNTDIKYDIREYLENSQNVNLMDYVQ